MERTIVWNITRRLERRIMAEKAAVAKVAPRRARVVVLMLVMVAPSPCAAMRLICTTAALRFAKEMVLAEKVRNGAKISAT